MKSAEVFRWNFFANSGTNNRFDTLENSFNGRQRRIYVKNFIDEMMNLEEIFFPKSNEINESNFCTSLRLSPDGSSGLVTLEEGDIYLSTMNTSTINMNETENQIMTLPKGERVYDTAFYPFYGAVEGSRCFAVSTRDHPVHLWDANGSLRYTYRAINRLDELEPVHCLAFNPSGTHLFGGANRVIQ